MRLRTVLPAATAGALMLGALALPTTAAAATAAPAGTSTHQDSVSQVGNYWHDYWQLLVSAYAPDGVSKITAHFRPHGSADGTPDSFVTSDLAPDAFNSGWVTQSPITLPALGVYDVDLDVTDSSGAVESFPDAGQYTYAAKVHVGAPTASTGTVDYDHRVYSLTAPVTVTDPGTGATLDPAGVSITLHDGTYNASADLTGTVDASGTMTASVTASRTSDYQPWNADGTSTAGYPYHFDGVSPNGVTVVAQADQTRIRILSGYNVKIPVGGHTVITGVLERLDGSTWVGTPSQTIYAGTGGCGGAQQVTTASDGTFQLPVSGAGAYYFCNYWDYDPFLQNTDTDNNPVYVHVPSPTSITGFSVTEDVYGEAVIDGHLYIGGGTFPGGTVPIYIQYSANGTTWHNVGTTKIGRSGIGADEFKCYATYGGTGNGYWRAIYVGSPDYSSSITKPVHIWRSATAVTGGKPNHTTVAHNAYVSFYGHVYQQRPNGSWAPITSSYAYLVFRPYQSTTWYLMAKVRTDSHGAYLLSARAPMSGTWSVVYLTPDSWHTDGEGPMTFVHA
ncbi:hypothetical protein ABH931_006426 [Streptacidiphilus sp. MAP12-33]|uniref:hypothetical protein n=1 Tax=Streptacidiphilus sp. MAP12-33 TaxID=3156266 RepID=UPI0035194AD1